MRLSVLIGVNEETGESEPIASGPFTEMNKLAKSLTVENTTKWNKVRLFEKHNKTYKLAAPKPKRGRKAKKELEEE